MQSFESNRLVRYLFNFEDNKMECFVFQTTGHCLDAKRNRNALGFINHSCVSQAEVAKLGGKRGIATVGGFNVKYVSRQEKRKEVQRREVKSDGSAALQYMCCTYGVVDTLSI